MRQTTLLVTRKDNDRMQAVIKMDKCRLHLLFEKCSLVNMIIETPRFISLINLIK